MSKRAGNVNVMCEPTTRHLPSALCLPPLPYLAMVSALPQELYDGIIDLIRDPTLRAVCSLVCKAWVLRSQRLLFSTLAISTRQRWHGLIVFLDGASHIAAMVEKLRVACQLVKMDRLERDQHCLPNITSLTFFGQSGNLDLLNYLPRLRTLKITPPDRDRPFACACDERPGVSLRAVMFSCDYATTNQLLGWLSRSDAAQQPHLKHLSVILSCSRAVTCAPQLAQLSHCLQTHSQVKTLELTLTWAAYIADIRRCHVILSATRYLIVTLKVLRLLRLALES
jgi:hypothetical protein